MLLLTATQSAKGPKSHTLSALPVRSIRQEGWHTWHLTAFIPAVLQLGLAAGISRLPQHTRLPLGHGYAPDAIQKGFWEATIDEWALLRRCAGPALGRIPFWIILVPRTQPECSTPPGTKATYWTKPSQSKAHHSQREACAPQK